MVNQMVTAVKTKLKIHSPSKLTEEEIGSPMGAGVPIGFIKAIAAGMPDVHAALGGIVGVGTFSVGGIPSVGVSSGSGGLPQSFTVDLPVIVKIGDQAVQQTVQRATLRYNGRHTTSGTSLPKGR